MASAVPVETPSEYNLKREYPRFIKFPDGEGVMHNVDLEAEPDMKLLEEINRNPANNAYYLFTRSVKSSFQHQHQSGRSPLLDIR